MRKDEVSDDLNEGRITADIINTLSITFLGTTSAKPTSTRNHSSLVLRFEDDVWLFDCGEATQHQIRKWGAVKIETINKIFITHTHGDHIFGICPLLASCMKPPIITTEGAEVSRPPLEVYGPLGTRAYIRNSLFYTHTVLNGTYVVHELRFPTDPQDGDYTALSRSPYELEGRNIRQVNGIWESIYSDGAVSVSAAPIYHSVPCVGYVVNECLAHSFVDSSNGTLPSEQPQRRGRKLVILGDTHNPSPIVELAVDADVLIHEATNSYLPPEIDPITKPTDTYEMVEARARSRGHSTPQMAGAFAKQVRAKKLVLNHFSSRYPGDDSESTERIMDAIGRLAGEEFGGEVVCDGSAGSKSLICASSQ